MLPVNMSVIQNEAVLSEVFHPKMHQFMASIRFRNGLDGHIRPIFRKDHARLGRFFASLSEESKYFRFCGFFADIQPYQLAQLCQVDYFRDYAFVAVWRGEEESIIGEVRLNRLADNRDAELSFVVADDWQGNGVGKSLMVFALAMAQEIGLNRLFMLVMNSNSRMKQFAYKYDFHRVSQDHQNGMEEFCLEIGSARSSFD